MVYIQNKKKRTPSEFLLDRIFRIGPTYWILTLIIITVLLVYPDVFRVLILTREWGASSMLFASDLVLSKRPLLYVGWTLEIEMFFYFLFAISLFAKSLRVSVMVVSILIFVVLMTRFISDCKMLIEFIYGMLIGLFFTKKKYHLNLQYFCLPLALQCYQPVCSWRQKAALTE